MTTLTPRKIEQIAIRLFTYWAPPVLWAIIIFSFSSEGVPRASEIVWKDFFVKKTVHLIEYGILSALFFRAARSQGVKTNRVVIFSLIVSVIYAMTDEFHQSFTPGREAAVRDVLIDIFGAFLGTFFLWKLWPRAPKKVKDWVEKLQC